MTTWMEKISRGEDNPFTVEYASGESYTAGYDEAVIADVDELTLPFPEQNAVLVVQFVSDGTRVETLDGEIQDRNSIATLSVNEPVVFVSDGTDWYVRNEMSSFYRGALPDFVGNQYLAADLDDGDIPDSVGDADLVALSGGGPTKVEDVDAANGATVARYDGSDDSSQANVNLSTDKQGVVFTGILRDANRDNNKYLIADGDQDLGFDLQDDSNGDGWDTFRGTAGSTDDRVHNNDGSTSDIEGELVVISFVGQDDDSILLRVNGEEIPSSDNNGSPKNLETLVVGNQPARDRNGALDLVELTTVNDADIDNIKSEEDRQANEHGVNFD